MGTAESGMLKVQGTRRKRVEMMIKLNYLIWFVVVSEVIKLGSKEAGRL